MDVHRLRHGNKYLLPTEEFHERIRMLHSSNFFQNIKAYRDKEENVCYLEKLNDRTVLEDLSEYGMQEEVTRVLYASTEALTKLEVNK